MMRGQNLVGSFVFLLVAVDPCAGERVIDFEEDVRPILENKCFGCHGPSKEKGRLRLDSPGAILRGGDSGEPLFVTGNREKSFLYKVISRQDPDEAMPPREKDAVSRDEIETIGSWIDAGAKLPESAGESFLKTDHWSFQAVAGEHRHDGVDAYLEEALKKKGLKFSSRADRRTLIRRLYLVMLGLPPSLEEVETFVKDESPRAWPDLIERVLASPHYGERMARHWLDIVRFAETNGFETNRERLTAYHFRDYVIESFNEDKGYDQFVREHLAGDMMGKTVATGFLVAGPHDVVKSPDKALTLMQRQDELADMINTTGTAFLGMTIGCARCHNHKFDPIRQKDYYAMQAVFAGVKFGERELPEREDSREQQEISDLRKRVEGMEVELEGLLSRGKAISAGRHNDDKRPAIRAEGNVDRFKPMEARFVRFTILQTNGGEPCIDELAVFSLEGANVSRGGKPSASGTLPGYDIHKLEHISDGYDGNSRSWISNTKGTGWVQLEFGKSETINRIEWARDRKGHFKDRVPVKYTIELSADGKHWSEVSSHRGRRQRPGADIDRDALLRLLPLEAAARGRVLTLEIAQAKKRMVELSPTRKAWAANFSQPGPTHRLYRGDPLAVREEVAPDAIPAISALDLETSSPEGERRKALANWIASAENPLTARVAVNRLWQFVFGTGLVDTPSDFGANGTEPSHPGLLDWMATAFVERGWSVKEMMRILLHSEAFQQSSFPNKEAEVVDAESRLLWRFPPRRLEAEAIRDGILMAAGTIDRRMGGPGFYLLEVERENVVHYHPKEDLGPPEWRRMIYMFKIRQEQDLVFGAFDCPDGNQVIPKRSRSTTPLQALNLLNSKFTMQQARRMAQRIGPGREGIVKAYGVLYGRSATEEEISDAMKFVEEHGPVSFCRAMLNTNEFLFVF
ncbi:MAG: DUF1553 domain-containing protein [Roseibacillus sp.]|nr:DUF1553 domain-containing protein [Roseibacillus sp.]